MEGRIVIVGYKPKPGKKEALDQLVRTHCPDLKKLDLVTDRPSIIMEAKDGTVIEVFEWKSQTAMEQAHNKPEILKMWGQYAEVCNYVPIGKIEEAGNLFSGFMPFE